MTRPLRLQFPGAVYQVTARGNARQAIFVDDRDRGRLVDPLAKEIEQQHWLCYAWCLMDKQPWLDDASADRSFKIDVTVQP